MVGAKLLGATSGGGRHQTAYSASYNQPNPKIPAADPTKVAMNREDY